MTVALETLGLGEGLPSAGETAAGNYRRNVVGIRAHQPELAERLSCAVLDGEWVWARDGYLTLRRVDGWWSGCSVPLAAAREMLKKLELVGTLGCFLNPSHAGQLRAALEKISATQAVLAVVPNCSNLVALLHCDDFSREIECGRLFFVAGDDWGAEMGALFEKFPGLPLPQQFLRTPLLEDVELGEQTSVAQPVISRETARRAERIAELSGRRGWSAGKGKVVVVAGSRLNASDFSNLALRAALLKCGGDIEFLELDTDRPLSASPLALAEAAADAEAVIAADLFRADLPGVVSCDTSWITWVTGQRIQPAEKRFGRDAILLADESLRRKAIDGGWSAHRIGMVEWPLIAPGTAGTEAMAGMIADTKIIEVPRKVREFSSQLLLWEHIEEELAADPLKLGDDPEGYLSVCMERLGIGDDGLDRGMFLERLIEPAYQQSVARILLKSGIPLVAFGRGWGEIAEFRACAGGVLETMDDLYRAMGRCRVVVQSSPRQRLGGLAVEVVRPQAVGRNRIVGEIRRALRGEPPRANGDGRCSMVDAVRSLLKSGHLRYPV